MNPPFEVAAARPRILSAPLLAPLAAGFALLVALALGDHEPGLVAAAGLLVGVLVTATAAAFPFAALLGVLASSMMLLVYTLPSGKGVNAFDVLLLPALAGIVVGTWRDRARADDARARARPEGAELLDETRRFTRAVLLYFGLAALSLSVTVALGRPDGALDSGLHLIRGLQGVLLFPVAMMLLRSERALHRAAGALIAGGMALAVVNAFAVLGAGQIRAGITWYVNEPLWSVGDPNEAGTAIVTLWALVLALHAARPRPILLVVLGLLLALLVLSQSRSGLLAWLTFTVLTLGRGRWKPALLATAVLALGIPLLSGRWLERMSHTVTAERGSFEVYSAMLRVYAWHASTRVFLSHPLIGVGYLGFRHFSDRYNDLGLLIGTSESIYLEIASGMGIVGLAVFGWAVWRLVRLGVVARRCSRPGSFGEHLASFHVPMVAALLVANITGDNWEGMIGLAQLAAWCALMLRACHESLRQEPVP